MAAPAWTVFSIVSVGLAMLVVALARQTAALLDDPDGPLARLSRRALYLNVVVSHGLVIGVLGVTVLLTGIPHGSLGLDGMPRPAAVLGLGLGLIALNEESERVADAFDAAENSLREFLEPETAVEWGLLLGVALPLVAVAEELLFRGALIGAVGTGTDLPAVLLIGGSAVAFGGAHTAQGWAGVGMATVIGLVFGIAFHLTGSLWLVIIAHYLVDLVEFVVHAGD